LVVLKNAHHKDSIVFWGILLVVVLTDGISNMNSGVLPLWRSINCNGGAMRRVE